MRHYPVIILYILVPVLGLIGLNDSAQQDRKDISLHRSMEVATQRDETQLQAIRGLRQDLDRQQQSRAVDAFSSSHATSSPFSASASCASPSPFSASIGSRKCQRSSISTTSM